MAWTTPRTWTPGELVTATQLNTHLRDNLNALAPAASTITTTGSVNALALPVGRGLLTIFANNASLLTIHGIAAGADGQVLAIYSIGAGLVKFEHQSGSAVEPDRIINQVTASSSLAAGKGHALFQYDTTAARWRVLDHQQGAPITATFAAGDFTGNGLMTWTVEAADVTTLTYIQRGKSVLVAIVIGTTTVGGTLDTRLRIHNAQWGGFSITKETQMVARVADANAWAPGFIQAPVNDTVLNIYRSMSAADNWSAATNTTWVVGAIEFEVQ